MDLRLEAGQVESRGNRFQLPGDSGTELHMPRERDFYYRLEAFKPVGSRGLVRVLYAPLTINYRSQAQENTVFDQTTFAAGETLKTKFRFNSYRVSYLYQLSAGKKKWQSWAGLTLKVRDAEIAVAGATSKDSYSNVGFVPLISLKSEWEFRPAWRLDGFLDGLGSPQGRAFDGSLEVNRQVSKRARLGAGWRFLEGGADNKKTENFTHLNYWFGSLLITL